MKTIEAINKKEVHKHIWKYREGSNIRVCEEPFPTIKSCGRIEMFCSHHKKYHRIDKKILDSKVCSDCEQMNCVC